MASESLSVSRWDELGDPRGSFDSVPIGEGEELWASWAALVHVSAGGSALESLVMGLEMRLQSSWLAAWASSSSAEHLLDSRGSPFLRHQQARWLEFELERIENISLRRLDAAAAELPTQIAELLVSTSDLRGEIAHARSQVRHAIRVTEAHRDQSTRRHDRITESLLLVFAASGVGQLLLPLPLTGQVVLEHPVSSGVLAAMVLAGLVLILTRR